MARAMFLREAQPAKTYYITVRGKGPAWRVECDSGNYALYRGRIVVDATCDLGKLLCLENLGFDTGLQHKLMAAALKLKDNQKVKVIYRQSS